MPGKQASSDALALVIRLNALLDSVAVRGLRVTGADDIARLSSQGEALAQIGASHLAESITALVADLRSGSRLGAQSLLKARASVRVFERLLSLRAVAADLRQGLAEAMAAESSERTVDAAR